MVEPDGAVGAGNLVAQVHAAAERPAHLELADGARRKPDERNRVVLVLDGVDHGVGGAHDLHRPVPLAHEVADDLDAVAAKVDDGAAARKPPVPEPRAVRAGVRLAGADPGHVAQGAVLNGLDGLERLGRVAEVLEVAAKDPRLLHGLQHSAGLVRGPAERLGAEHGLAGLGDGLDGLLVEVVGQRHHDNVSLGVADGRLHVGGELRDAPPIAKRLAPALAARVDNPDPVPAALAVQRHGVEVADQPGAEHRDGVGLHCGSGSLQVADSDSRRTRVLGEGDRP